MGMAGLTGIEATDSTSVPLPPLTATAIRFDAHGPPADVLYLDPLHALPQTLKHGEVPPRLPLARRGHRGRGRPTAAGPAEPRASAILGRCSCTCWRRT